MSDEPVSEKAQDVGYRVLARKYRPATFDDLIGQQPMVQTLTNAFEIGRIAQAYMLTGVRGVGKTTTARILARALNYETADIHEPTIDLKEPGEHCQAIMEGNHVDVIEMDAASHTGIGDIREIIAAVRYKPVSARYKVYIIDEVHMLSTAAFNGLLKTLEEPPEHVKFIFATTEIRKVPITVLSRCQRFDLRRIEAREMMELLQKTAKLENVEAEDAALAMIARAGEGSARDAMSLLDQAIAHAAGTGGGKVEAEDVRQMLGLADRARVIDLFEHLMKGDIAASLDELKSQYDVGADPATVLTDLAEFVHLVTRARYVEAALDDPSLSESEKTRGKEFAKKLSPKILGRTWQMLLKGLAEVQAASRPLEAADMVLVRIAHAANLPGLDEALKMVADGGAAAIPAKTAEAAPSGTVPPGTAPANMSAAAPARMAEETSPTPATSATLQAAPDNSPRMQRQANGPSLAETRGMAETEEQIQPSVEPEASPAPAPDYDRIENFDHLLAAAEKHRDIRFKLQLRNHVDLVHMEKGRMELRIVGEAPRNFVSVVQGKLKDWTGDNWLVAVSEAEGEGTLRDREKAHKAALFDDAEQDPVVAAVLKTFPKSRVIDVRVLKDETEDLEADFESGAETIPVDPDGDRDDDDAQPDGDPGAGSLDDYFN